MRITRDNSANLTVVDFPWAWGLAGGLSFVAIVARIVYEHVTPAVGPQNPWAMLAGGACIAVGCGLFSTRVELSMDRAAGTLRWTQTGLTGRRRKQMPFDRVRQTVLRQSHGSSRRRPSWRLVVETADGDLPLSFSYELGDSARERCFEIGRRIESVVAERNPAEREAVPG